MEMAMCRLLLRVTSVLAALSVGACGPRLFPAAPAGLAGLPLKPGQYVQESYFAPDFKPDEASYTFGAFPVTEANGAPAEKFLKIFQDELVSAWQAQGLKLGPGENACLLSGTIWHLSVKGARLRWLTGRLFASLSISGEITRGGQVLFAFRDQVEVSSPLSPGPAAPREQELLLRQLARETVHHLLNELLLHGATVSGARSAITRMMILGLCTTLVKSSIMPM
jgi:hypothetical protein